MEGFQQFYAEWEGENKREKLLFYTIKNSTFAI
jgi:hypothetical protein